jgi:hypothetical protein
MERASHARAFQGHFEQQSGRSGVVAGLGAALVASVLTIALMASSHAPVATPDQTAAASNTTQCQVIQRKLLVSTETGGGTVRLRAGSYLSPPISLARTPQEVVFPVARPTAGFVNDVIVVEGTASNVVITSPITNFRQVLDITGVAAFDLRWMPMKPC